MKSFRLVKCKQAEEDKAREALINSLISHHMKHWTLKLKTSLLDFLLK